MPSKTASKSSKDKVTKKNKPIKDETDSEGDSEEEDSSDDKENDVKPDKQQLNNDPQPLQVQQPVRTTNRSWKNLPFLKGAFVLRLSDVGDGNQFNWVWKIDNHQLIRKYLKEEGGKSNANDVWYIASNRYSGWLTNEAWRFMSVEVGQQIKSETEKKVRILWPSKEKIDQALEKIKVEEAKLNKEKEKNGTSHFAAMPAPMVAKKVAAKSTSKTKRANPPAKKSRKSKKKDSSEEESEKEEVEENEKSDDGEEEVDNSPVQKRQQNFRATKAAKKKMHDNVETIE